MLILLGAGLFWWYNEPLPEGTAPERADDVADKMLSALNMEAWEQIEAIQWTYPGGHHYIWDKANDLVLVEWSDNEVYLHTPTQQAIVFSTEQPVDTAGLISDAVTYFFNDSFWLIAPYKIKDPGTVRYLVDAEISDKQLMVTYSSGGVTPGDTYLWKLDDNYRPVSWKFWVKIVPIGGMEFTWDCWETHDGAEISTCHDGLLLLEVTDLQTGTLEALATPEQINRFAELEKLND